MAKKTEPQGASRGSQATAAAPRKQAAIVDSVKSRCPKCQSTDRTPYSGTVTVYAPGIDCDQPYTHVVKRWTRCAKCGQARVDQSQENRK